MVRGVGLAGILRKHDPRWVVVVAISLLVMADTIARVFKWLTLSLFAYTLVALVARPDMG